MQKFINKFEEEEFYGRQALLELQRLYPNYFKYEIHFSTDSYSTFDAYWIILDENMSIKKRIIVEIKQRSEDYDEMILESKKYQALLKYREDLYLSKEEMSILYANFTPTKTIIWNLDEIEVKIDTLKANKTTVDSKTRKVNKGVIYLTPESGIVLPYVLNKKKIIMNNLIDVKLNKTEKELKKGLETLFENYGKDL